MTKNILFVVLLLMAMILICSNTPANAATECEAILENLRNKKQDETAICRMKTDDFVFFCTLDKDNYRNCRVGFGINYTLPSCKPVACVETDRDCEPGDEKLVPADEPPTNQEQPPRSNPLLDLLNGKTQKY